MTQMTQNFNPVIHIQKDSKSDTQNGTVLKWLAVYHNEVLS